MGRMLVLIGSAILIAIVDNNIIIFLVIIEVDEDQTVRPWSSVG